MNTLDPSESNIDSSSEEIKQDTVIKTSIDKTSTENNESEDHKQSSCPPLEDQDMQKFINNLNLIDQCVEQSFKKNDMSYDLSSITFENSDYLSLYSSALNINTESLKKSEENPTQLYQNSHLHDRWNQVLRADQFKLRNAPSVTKHATIEKRFTDTIVGYQPRVTNTSKTVLSLHLSPMAADSDTEEKSVPKPSIDSKGNDIQNHSNETPIPKQNESHSQAVMYDMSSDTESDSDYEIKENIPVKTNKNVNSIKQTSNTLNTSSINNHIDKNHIDKSNSDSEYDYDDDSESESESDVKSQPLKQNTLTKQSNENVQINKDKIGTNSTNNVNTNVNTNANTNVNTNIKKPFWENDSFDSDSDLNTSDSSDEWEVEHNVSSNIVKPSVSIKEDKQESSDSDEWETVTSLRQVANDINKTIKPTISSNISVNKQQNIDISKKEQPSKKYSWDESSEDSMHDQSNISNTSSKLSTIQNNNSQSEKKTSQNHNSSKVTFSDSSDSEDYVVAPKVPMKSSPIRSNRTLRRHLPTTQKGLSRIQKEHSKQTTKTVTNSMTTKDWSSSDSDNNNNNNLVDTIKTTKNSMNLSDNPKKDSLDEWEVEENQSKMNSKPLESVTNSMSSTTINSSIVPTNTIKNKESISLIKPSSSIPSTVSKNVISQKNQQSEQSEQSEEDDFWSDDDQSSKNVDISNIPPSTTSQPIHNTISTSELLDDDWDNNNGWSDEEQETTQIGKQSIQKTIKTTDHTMESKQNIKQINSLASNNVSMKSKVSLNTINKNNFDDSDDDEWDSINSSKLNNTKNTTTLNNKKMNDDWDDDDEYVTVSPSKIHVSRPITSPTISISKVSKKDDDWDIDSDNDISTNKMTSVQSKESMQMNVSNNTLSSPSLSVKKQNQSYDDWDEDTPAMNVTKDVPIKNIDIQPIQSVGTKRSTRFNRKQASASRIRGQKNQQIKKISFEDNDENMNQSSDHKQVSNSNLNSIETKKTQEDWDFLDDSTSDFSTSDTPLNEIQGIKDSKEQNRMNTKSIQSDIKKSKKSKDINSNQQDNEIHNDINIETNKEMNIVNKTIEKENTNWDDDDDDDWNSIPVTRNTLKTKKQQTMNKSSSIDKSIHDLTPIDNEVQLSSSNEITKQKSLQNQSITPTSTDNNGLSFLNSIDFEVYTNNQTESTENNTTLTLDDMLGSIPNTKINQNNQQFDNETTTSILGIPLQTTSSLNPVDDSMQQIINQLPDYSYVLSKTFSIDSFF